MTTPMSEDATEELFRVLLNAAADAPLPTLMNIIELLQVVLFKRVEETVNVLDQLQQLKPVE